jgi:hypothetical protein
MAPRMVSMADTLSRLPMPAPDEEPAIDDPRHPLYGQRHGGSFVTGFIDALRDLVTGPTRAISGQLNPRSDEGIDEIKNAAGALSLGPAAIPGTGLRSGANLTRAIRPKAPDAPPSRSLMGMPDVLFQGKSPHDFTPGEWGAFGQAHGVPNLGPADDAAFQQGLRPYTTLSGKEYTVPSGGLESKQPFTYYDLLHMKQQGLNPNDLDPAVHQAIHDRIVAGVQPTGPLSDMQVFNQLSMGMLSPNNPLTANELGLARVMAKSPEDIARIASYAPPPGATPAERQAISRQMTQDLGLGAGSGGGLGATGSVDYSRVADMASMMQQKPEFFRFKGAGEGGANDTENWANFVQRIGAQIPGLSAKTGSFGTVWQDPQKAATSAIDRHMARKFTTEMFPSQAEADAFGQKLFTKYNTERGLLGTPQAVTSYDQLLQAPGGRGAFDDDVFNFLNAHPEMKYRLAPNKEAKAAGLPGEINPKVPQAMQDADWVREPKSVQVISEPYKAAVAANAAESAKQGQGVFSNQWMLWDRIRQRLEPHEIMFPGLEKLPRMSMDQMRRANQDLGEAGYRTSPSEVRPLPSASRAAYFSTGHPAASTPFLDALYADKPPAVPPTFTYAPLPQQPPPADYVRDERGRLLDLRS